MRYGRTVHLHTDVATAVARAREALTAQGLRVFTEVDFTTALKVRRARHAVGDCVILGVCGAPPAHHVPATDRCIGVRLPCYVAVRADGDHTAVQALDPHTMVVLTGLEELRPVADDAFHRIDAALTALTSPIVEA
jgi:uncharacterized protein (DUF302 family)